MSKIKETPKPLPPKPAPIVRRLMDLTAASVDDPNTLLGNRFLCRGGGLLFVGQTGVGKSTAVIQLGMCWAIGKNCFGINPAKALKILYVQAENDEADLSEMRDGVLENLNLNDEERETLAENFVCVFESSRAGNELGETIDTLLREHAPDLLVIDPALSYVGGDSNSQEVVGGFLRNTLNPLLQKHDCGALIVHHTKKPGADRDTKRIATDAAYAGTGSAEWGNWARAVLVLSAKDDNGLRELKIGKRFRLGWKDANGARVVSKLLQQNVEGALFYSELTGDAALLASGNVSPTQKVLRSDVLPEPGEDVEKKILLARIAEARLCGERKARSEVIPWLIGEGFLTEKHVPRPNGPAAVHLLRTDKKPNVISFNGG